MAVNVRIPTQLRELSGGAAEVDVEGATVAEVLKQLEATHPGFAARLYDEKGQRSSTMTAREGEMNDLTHDMTARGDVVIQATEGTRMTTDLLHFLNKRQRIETESFVRVDRGGDVLTGYGFESDPELKDFQFKRQVKATVRTRSGGAVESRKGTP